MRKIFVILFLFLLPLSAFAACTSAQIDVNGDGSQCETSKFELTTTSDATTLQFSISAQGTFYVDCGDGGTLTSAADPTDVSGKTISRADTTVVEYTCTWGSAGAHTIRFSGTATLYSTHGHGAISFYKSSGGTSDSIESIDGDLSAIFQILGNGENQKPRFYNTFRATKLTSIPETLFRGITQGAPSMFSFTFSGSKITTIPSGLFGGITAGEQNMFGNTFTNCKNLTTIPDGLFSNITVGALYMFSGTFYGCVRLTSIPENLFSGITTGTQLLFEGTFVNCTSLTSVPNRLFANITTAADGMFQGTFYGCTNLSGYIPPSTFTGLIANGHPTATDMWTDTFTGTNISTSCPSGIPQYTTGYESEWGGKVSCGCPGGQVLNMSTNTCEACAAGTYSDGGAVILDASVDGNSYTQSPLDTGTGSWTVSFDYGTLGGIAACTATNGSWATGYSQYTFSQGETSGIYCWCKMTSPINSFWVIDYYYGSVSGCANGCADNCARLVQSNSEYRNGLFNSTEYKCKSCTNSKPEHSSYTGSAASNSCPWSCDTNYTEYKNACHGFCSGNRKLRIGTNPITTYPAFSDKTNVPSPVLHIKDANDEICYIYFEPDVGGEHGVKVLWTDGKKYHAVDPTQ